MRLQKSYYFRLLITIILTLCLSIVVSLNNGVLAAKPGKARLVSPMGTGLGNTPTFTWNAVLDSTHYNLLVNDSTGNSVDEWYTAEDAGCGIGSGICSITPDTELGFGSYEWWIQTGNNDGDGDLSDSLSFTVEEGFNEASIQGTYAFTGMEQGGAPAPLSDSVVQEAAMGIITADGNGSIIGKISLNMYDFLDQDPGSDRLVLPRFPITGAYTIEDDGFGTMINSIDFDQDGAPDLEISGNLVITKRKGTMALEFWFIGNEPTASGSIVITHFFKREQS